MSPLRRRIAYKKKGRPPFFRYLLILLFISVLVYLLFYFRLGNKTIYERAVGFFKSEIEKSPAITIIESNKNTKNTDKVNQRKSESKRPLESKKDTKRDNQEEDEIENVIKKKLQNK